MCSLYQKPGSNRLFWTTKYTFLASLAYDLMDQEKLAMDVWLMFVMGILITQGQLFSKEFHEPNKITVTVKALVSGHPLDTIKMSATGAGR